MRMLTMMKRWWGCVALAAICSGLAAGSLWADISSPRPQDALITQHVAQLLEEHHLSRQKIDDSISKRLFAGFLARLDPNKMYFLQLDIDELRRYETQLDDQIHRGELTFAYQVLKKFLERVDQRRELVDELLAGEFDFSQEETMVVDADQLDYPKDEPEARERWRKRLKYELLDLKIDGVEMKEAIDRLSHRYESLARRLHQIDNDELLEMYLGGPAGPTGYGLCGCFDPHTDYMSPSSLEDFHISMRLKLNGIGAELRQKDEYTEVVRILPGGAAAEDGRLKPGDKIVSVAQGEDGKMVDVVGMKLRDVVKLIRGQPGTMVRLEVIPADEDQRRVYSLSRRTVEITERAAQAEIVENGTKADGQLYRIGVIKLDSFYVDATAAARGEDDYRSTTRDVRRILEDFNKTGVDAVILDLRSNGGGFLSEAINLTGLFIDKGPVVQVRDFQGRVSAFNDPEPEAAYQGPLVVLVNKLSASAAEILAAAIQDYGRGLVVGDSSTHGKGTVQNLLDLSRELRRPGRFGALKLTMQGFYRIDGHSTQKYGVHPDVVLPSPYLLDHMEVGEEHLPGAMSFEPVNGAEHPVLGMVSDQLKTQLRQLSEARREKSEEFQKLAQRVEKFLERQQRTEVPLQEAELRDELQDNPEEDLLKLEEEEGGGEEDIKAFPSNFYNDEVLAITRDYLRISPQLGLAVKVGGAQSQAAN